MSMMSLKLGDMNVIKTRTNYSQRFVTSKVINKTNRFLTNTCTSAKKCSA